MAVVANLPSPDRETASAVRAFLTYSIIIARERIEHRLWFSFCLKLEHQNDSSITQISAGIRINRE